MPKTGFIESDMRHFNHPFMPVVVKHVNATHAFQGQSKLSVQQNQALMYWFVAGAKYKDVENVTHYLIPDGEQPNAAHVIAKDHIPVQTIRKRYKAWRDHIFLSRRLRRHVFQKALEKSYIYQVYGNSIANWVHVVCDLIFDSDDTDDERSQKKFILEDMHRCLYGCSKNRTVPFFRESFNSITPTDLYIVVWRTFLNDEAINPGFQQWHEERFVSIANNLRDNSISWCDEKANHCKWCETSIIKNTYRNLIFDIMKYLSNFRIKNIDEFSMLFGSAALYALGRACIWSPIRELKMQRDRWDMLSEREREVWSGMVYETDKIYQRYVNSVAGAMIDCLTEKA